MSKNATYLTPERYEELGRELGELRTEGRRRVAERLKQSKELGDLSENSDYQEAREEQSRLEKQIGELEELLRTSQIIRKTNGVVSARIGSKIKVKKGDDLLFYTIVGSNEAQPAKGLISNESPIGEALLGKKVGDVAEAKTPKGTVYLEILAIE